MFVARTAKLFCFEKKSLNRNRNNLNHINSKVKLMLHFSSIKRLQNDAKNDILYFFLESLNKNIFPPSCCLLKYLKLWITHKNMILNTMWETIHWTQFRNVLARLSMQPYAGNASLKDWTNPTKIQSSIEEKSL